MVKTDNITRERGERIFTFSPFSKNYKLKKNKIIIPPKRGKRKKRELASIIMASVVPYLLLYFLFLSCSL